MFFVQCCLTTPKVSSIRKEVALQRRNGIQIRKVFVDQRPENFKQKMRQVIPGCIIN